MMHIILITSKFPIFKFQLVYMKSSTVIMNSDTTVKPIVNN